MIIVLAFYNTAIDNKIKVETDPARNYYPMFRHQVLGTVSNSALNIGIRGR